MADRVLILDIVTPDRNLFSGEVNMVVAPALHGEVGILPLHAPFLAELSVGELRFTSDDGNDHPGEEYVAVSGGFMEVLEDKVTVISPSAEFAREIDIERAQRAVVEAKEALSEKSGVDMDKVEASLMRAESRLKIAQRFGR